MRVWCWCLGGARTLPSLVNSVGVRINAVYAGAGTTNSRVKVVC